MALTQVNGGMLDSVAQQVGFRNRIINGAMGIWQRGTSGFTSSGNYSADRFIVSTGTSLSAVGQSSDVPSGFKYSISVAGTNQTSIRQYIESVNCTDLVGQSITVSFWLKQSAGAGSNAMYIYLAYANSADNFSGLTQIGSAVNITTTSSWAQYTATFTNLPAGAGNGVALLIGSNSAGSTTYLVTGVQLEKGSTATSFDYRPYGTELALCQRYYEKSYAQGTVPGSGAVEAGANSCWGSSDGAGNVVIQIPFKVTKRTTPIATFWATDGTINSIYYNKNGAQGSSAATIYRQTDSIMSVYGSIGANWTIGNGAVQWVASAEL